MVMSDNLENLKRVLLGRYTLVREIGSGAMATVYLALDLKHDRQVALKVLNPELSAAIGAERFLREIKFVARLNHPNILALFDSGECDGLFYYVAPFVTGDNLRARVEHGRPLPVDEALRIAGEVASALDHAHRHGIVHRDIKPENVLLQDGHAIVADFGIARALASAGDQSLTYTGIAIGTPAYMSPEQASGERDVDGRSDLYSLGCVLYEMLTGERPFSGPTPQAVIRRRLTEDPPTPRLLRDSITDQLSDTVVRALARDPSARFKPLPTFSMR
jgi:serine/threonine-protein kinase